MVEAAGIEPASTHFYNVFKTRKIQLKPLRQNRLASLRIYQNYARFIRVFSSNAPVLLPRGSVDVQSDLSSSSHFSLP